MVIYKVTITDGLEFLEYNIYYNNIESNIPQLYDITTSGTTGPATNIPYSILKNGVYVSVPDATSVINIKSTAPYCDYVFSECVRIECCGTTPTPTPTPSHTPTPTPTPTPKPPSPDCIECVDQSYNTTFVDCGPYSYPKVERKIVCTYQNSTGGTIPAPTTVTIQQAATTVGCGGSGYAYFNVVIPSGSTTGSTIYTAEITENCGDYGCITTYQYYSGYTVPEGYCSNVCTSPSVCMAIYVTGATGPEVYAGTISYNDCDGQLVNEVFSTQGIRYRCIQYIDSVPQIFSSTGLYYEIYAGYSCSSGTCPTNRVDPLPGVTPTPTPTGTPTNTPTSTPTPTPSSTVGPVTPTPTGTPTPTPIVYTYVAGCSGGTILGYILGDYSSNLQFTATDTNCYVTTYTTVSPSIGSLLTVSSWGSCCPTPTPTPVPPPVGVGIYSGATFGSASSACADTNYPNGTVYIPNGDTLSNGDILYVDTTLFTQFTGNDNYYRLYFGGQFYAATISSLGYVSNLTLCSSTPTPTPTSTLTPTPTPTPTPSGISYELYTADRYECIGGTCSYVETIEIANPVVMIGGKFYFDNINGYILNVSGTGTGGPYLYTDCSGLGTNNCSSLCGL